MNLPIDIVPNTSPPHFRWRQIVSTPVGDRMIEHSGPLPPSMEDAVAALIGLAKRLEMENTDLKKQIQGHCDRIAAQSELLSKRAEQKEKLLSSRRDKGQGG
jgi:hypothetical protein